MDSFCTKEQLTVDDAHHLWRLVKDSEDYLIWDYDKEHWTPKVNGYALQFNNDLSTYWEEHLITSHSFSGIQLIKTRDKREVIFRIQVGGIRNLNCNVYHDPTDPYNPPHCGHSLVKMPEGLIKTDRKRLKYQIANLMSLSYGEPRIPRPPSR